jgi:hypothetical protein
VADLRTELRIGLKRPLEESNHALQCAPGDRFRMMERRFGASNMRIHVAKALLLLVLALSAQPASAFLDPPYITPANPHAGDLISVNIYGGECDLVDDGVVWPPPVSQQGNELTILLTGGHQEDPEFCYVGVGTYTFPVGVYQQGAYTLKVDWRYSTFSGWMTETLGIIPFTVSAAPSQQPIETPTLSIAGLAALGLALLVAMLRNLREHAA